MSDPIKEIKKALKEGKLPPLYPDSANHPNDTNSTKGIVKTEFGLDVRFDSTDDKSK